VKIGRRDPVGPPASSAHCQHHGPSRANEPLT
jgi:hypothetical protein